MTKKAICVGINDYPGEENDLNGCVNDGNDWANRLLEHFDFPSSDAKVMTDSEATKQNMIGPDGVALNVISGSCFSGTVTRAAPFRPVPDDRRERFLNPRVRGDEELTPTEFNTARSKRPEKYPESGMKEILLGGASDKQYATDAVIEGSYHGAMTYFAIQAIREANYQITYAQLIERLRDLIAPDYSQDPQLEAQEANKQKKIFT